VLLAFAAAACAAGCQSPPVPAAEFVVQADQIHDAALAATVAPDGDLNDYLNEIGRRIIAGATAANPNNTKDPTLANVKFHLVASPEVVNVFGTGGRHVYVYSGLFRNCETEEELAALMAHAYAHALDLDLQQTRMRPDPGRTLENLDRVIYAFVTNRTTAEHERRADERAFEFYARGGWDPRRFGNIFEVLRDKGIEGATGPALPDRPSLEQRISLARDRLSGLPGASRDWRKPNVADNQTYQQLRTAAGNLPEGPGPTLNRSWLYLRAFPNCVLPTDGPKQREAQEWLRVKLMPPLPEQGVEPS
jgi:predicted Zn-dependent protease